MYLDLLTSNGLIIKSRYYDFTDSIPIVKISVEITHVLTWFIINYSMVN